MSDETKAMGGRMLIWRRIGENVKIGDNITVGVVDVRPDGKVRIGVTAPREVPVWRSELLEVSKP